MSSRLVDCTRHSVSADSLVVVLLAFCLWIALNICSDQVVCKGSTRCRCWWCSYKHYYGSNCSARPDTRRFVPSSSDCNYDLCLILYLILISQLLVWQITNHINIVSADHRLTLCSFTSGLSFRPFSSSGSSLASVLVYCLHWSAC